jgi:hypothetical protein
MRRAWLAELRSEHELLQAARALKGRGLARLELYSPFPIEGAAELLELRRSRLPLLSLICGLLGAGGAYLLQWYCDAWDWPLVAGSRPIHPAPAFVPITFETGVLCAAAAAFFGSLWASGLPRLSHPIFESDAFRSATQAGFWVSVETASDDEHAQARRSLEELGASQLRELEGAL